jgi:hypothetical protein
MEMKLMPKATGFVNLMERGLFSRQVKAYLLIENFMYYTLKFYMLDNFDWMMSSILEKVRSWLDMW